jgi:septation ring formation regulator EzrA
MKNEDIFALIVLLVVVIVVLFVLPIGLDKQANVRCLELQRQKEEFTGFTSTDYEKETCNHFGINLR